MGRTPGFRNRLGWGECPPIPHHASLHEDSVHLQELAWVTWSAHKVWAQRALGMILGVPWKTHIDLSLFYLDLCPCP